MKRIVIHPFFSQQDKVDFRFLLHADVTTQISRYLADILRELGHSVFLVLPHEEHCVGGYPEWTQGYHIMPVPVLKQNKLQRLDFDPVAMSGIIRDTELFINHNEISTWKLRQLAPDLPIIHFNHLMPIGDWQWMRPMQLASWQAATLNVFLSAHLQDFAMVKLDLNISKSVKSAVWPLVYSTKLIRPRVVGDPATTDILFVQRCSQSNYTHHREFIAAIDIMRRDGFTGTVTFTDPTHYLEQHEPPAWARFAHAESRDAYYQLLNESRVAVAMMNDDLHGGVAIREAIATGCLPVLFDVTAYRVMLGSSNLPWPFFVGKPINPEWLADALARALLVQDAWATEPELASTFHRIREEVAQDSYEQNAARVAADMTRLIEENPRHA